MSKIKQKTKSSAKKRFKFTGSGNVMMTQANKRHNMRKRSNRQIRNQRGIVLINHREIKRIRKYMPYDAH